MQTKPLWIGLLIAGAAVFVEIAAKLNVRREQARRRYLGERLYTRALGAGDPVVFIPGFQGSTEFWQRAFDSLASDRRLIFLDTLGFGRSQWPNTAPTLEDHLSALRETLVTEGAVHRVTLVAHSFGTLLAAYYADRYSNEIDRLVLLGTPVFLSEMDARVRLREISPMGALFSLNRLLARQACTIMCAFRPLLEMLLPRLAPRVPRGVAHDSVLHNWPAADGAFRNILLARFLPEPLHHIGEKVIFVHGRADRITPLARIRELAAETGATVIESSDVHLSYPARSAQLILGAIESRPASLHDSP